MNPLTVYRFCLCCGGELIPKEKRFLQCSICGYNIYNNPKPCNAVVIENREGEILLTCRKNDPRKGFWDLPGGFIEAGENLIESVKREVKEELNVEIEIGQIVSSYNDIYSFQNVDLPIFGIGVTAKIVSGKIKIADDVSGYEFFSKETVLKQKIAFKSITKTLKDYLEMRKKI